MTMKATNEKRTCPGKDKPANATNGRQPTTPPATGASARRGQAVKIGEIIWVAMAEILTAGVRP